MIVDLPGTTVAEVGNTLQKLRDDVGAMALSRVLTLITVVDDKHADEALKVATAATHMHPARIVALVAKSRRGESRIDGQVWVGGDAGASEVVVLRLSGGLNDHAESVALPLLLADSPVVAWWPTEAPHDLAADPIGALAQRRISDAQHTPGPAAAITSRAETYVDGDTDLDWTRITKWRGLLAAALDEPPYEPVTAVVVTGGVDSASADLLGAWLGEYLDAPVTRARTAHGTGLISVRLERTPGPIDLVRPDGLTATLRAPGQPVRRLALARRQDAECLSDELARLDPDEVYGRTLTHGLARITRVIAASEAVERGVAPSPDASRAEALRMARESRSRASASMVEREVPSDDVADEAIRAAIADKLRTPEPPRGTLTDPVPEN